MLRKTEPDKKTAGTGQKISRSPEIEKKANYLFLKGKTIYAIYQALKKSGYKITYPTVRDYFRNMTDEKKAEIEYLYNQENLTRKKNIKKTRLVGNTKDTVAFLNEMMDELNMKAALLSRSLDVFPDSKDAMALVKFTDAMIDIQKELASVNDNISVLKKDIVDDILYRVSELFFQFIMPLIPPVNRTEVSDKMKNELERISREVLK